MSTPSHGRLVGLERPPDDAASLVQWEQEILDAAVYRALPQSSAVVDACTHLRQAIVLCLLPAGSKLPTEPVLAERLGVGVVTMRIALATLREEGFIVTTRGRKGGSWVVDDDAIVKATARATAYSGAELRNTIDMLIAVETQAVGLAALRATPDERREISALGAYPRERLTAREWQMYANVLHLRIAHATHNPQLAAAVRASRARLQELRTAGAGRIVFCVRSSVYHTQVVDLIVRGESDAARQLCFEFLTDCWECNLTVIESRATRDEHLVDVIGGCLGARRYTADPGEGVGSSASGGLRLVGQDEQVDRRRPLGGSG
ncbi:MAG: FadR/GntR family transcriptional regulator [Gaiellales bacterium]